MSGRDTPGNVFSDKAGNLFSAVTGNPIVDGKEQRPGPVLKGEREPAPEPAAASSAEVDAELDQEDVATERAMLKAGMSVAEVARLRGRAPDQVGKPSVAALTRQTIDAELSKLAEMRRRDPKTYWGNETQEREKALYEARDRLQSAKIEAAAVEPKDRATANTAALDPGLVQEWERSGGFKHHLETAQATANSVLEALEPGEADEFSASFDGLPAGVQTSIFRHIGIDGGGFSRTATAAQLNDFGALCPEAASVVRGWGSRAAQKLGAAYARLDAIEADYARAEAWLRSRSPTQRTSLMKALAGR